MTRRVIDADKDQAMIQCITQADAPMKRPWHRQIIQAKQHMPLGDPAIGTGHLSRAAGRACQAANADRVPSDAAKRRGNGSLAVEEKRRPPARSHAPQCGLLIHENHWTVHAPPWPTACSGQCSGHTMTLR